MEITNIKKNKGFGYALFVDGEFIFTVDDETIYHENLKRGRVVDEEYIDNLRGISGKKWAKKKAFDLLSARSYTRKEIIDKILPYTNEEGACEIADRMEELGLICDSKYALSYARDRFLYRSKGAKVIKGELLRKGIDRETIEEALDEVCSGEDTEVSAVYDLIKKKYINKLDDRKSKGNTIASLLRRGYSYDSIKRAFAKIEEDE